MTTEKHVRKAQDGSVLLAAEAVEGEETEIVALVSSAHTLAITTPAELESSSGLLTNVKARQKAMNDLRLSITRPMDTAKKRVLDLFQPAMDRLATAERTIKMAVLTYTQEQRRLQEDAQARLDAEAERERLRLETLAAKQRTAGKDDRAEATEERAAIVQAPTVAVADAPAGAVHVRTIWHAEVTDLAALAKAVAEDESALDLDLIQPNMVALNALARSLQGDLSIPGVKAVAEEGVSARAG